jgi:hypothetical protein
MLMKQRRHVIDQPHPSPLGPVTLRYNYHSLDSRYYTIKLMCAYVGRIEVTAESASTDTDYTKCNKETA